MSRTPGYIPRDTSGAAAIEFAIVAPVFLLMLFLMIGYGIYLGAASSVQQLSADAARASIAGLDETERTTLASQFIENNVSKYVFMEPNKVAVSVGDDDADTNQFVISVRYDASDLPIWGIYGAYLLPGKTITRKTSIRMGGT